MLGKPIAATITIIKRYGPIATTLSSQPLTGDDQSTETNPGHRERGLALSDDPTYRNIRETCGRGIAGNSQYHRGTLAHAATDDRSHRPSLLPPLLSWRPAQRAYQELV